MFYLVILFLLFIFACLDLSASEKLKNILFLTGITLLALIAGLRYETGIDWAAYEIHFFNAPSFNQISLNMLLTSPDLGYFFLVSFVKTLGGNVQVVFFLMACISFFFLYKSLPTYTPYKNISLLLYFCIIFFVLDMSGMRQAVALNIFFFAIRYIQQKKLTKYILFLLLAFSFHWTAIVFLPFYFFINKRIPLWLGISIVAVSTAIALFKIEWMHFFIEKLYLYIPHEGLKNNLELYVLNPSYMQRNGFGRSIVIIFIIFIALSFYRKKLGDRFPYFNLFYNIYICLIFFTFAFAENSDVSIRFRLYTEISTIILLPYFICLVGGYKQYILYFCIAVYGFWFMKGYLLRKDLAVAYNPYQNYLIHKIFRLESNGEERLMMHKALFEQAKSENAQQDK